jgi:hypothetical protein
MNEQDTKPIQIKSRPTFLHVLVRSVGLLFLLCGVVYGALCLSFNGSDVPPGYKSWFDFGGWNTERINRFLGTSLPTDAVNLQIEGRMGMQGSYGITPSLEFSFQSSPASAAAFAEGFCGGVLHTGYDPLQAVESSIPSDDAVLIRVNRSIHYSRSPGVPLTTRGNRCGREQYLEEITLDEAHPEFSKVSYRLPYAANNNTWEYYPYAETVRPFGNDFRLYITGVHGATETNNVSTYHLSYPILCFSTLFLPRSYEFVVGVPDVNEEYKNSAVAISIDGVAQSPAKISENGVLALVNGVGVDSWSYCLTPALEGGMHTLEIRVSTAETEVKMFTLEFIVPHT